MNKKDNRRKKNNAYSEQVYIPSKQSIDKLNAHYNAIIASKNL